MRRLSDLVILTMGLAGCSGEPSHVPPLWQLPGTAVSSAFENAAYDARRREVKRLVSLDQAALLNEIDTGGGPRLTAAMDASGIAPEKRPVVLSELGNRPDIYRTGTGGLDIEAVTVTLMIYGR